MSEKPMTPERIVSMIEVASGQHWRKHAKAVMAGWIRDALHSAVAEAEARVRREEVDPMKAHREVARQDSGRIRAEEREACADVMEDIYLSASSRTSCACVRAAYETAATDGASAIRARGEGKEKP